MENQKTSLLKRKNRWGLTVLSIVVCLVMTPLLGVTVFLPQVLSMIPVVLLLLLGYVGPVSAMVCCAVMALLCFLLFGFWGMVAALMMFVPVVAVSAFMAEHDKPFWESVAAGCVTMFASMGAVVALLTALAGSDVVTALSGITRQAFTSSGVFGDTLLSMLMQMGVLRAPEGVDLSAGMAVLTTQMREEMTSALIMMMDSVLRLELPMQMATGSVAAGLLGQAALRKAMIHSGQKIAYPKLKTWRVPAGWGRILGGTLAVLYLLATLVPRSMNTMFYVFSGVFDQLFSLQGIAALCYLLDERGKSRHWQKAVFVVGYFFLGSIAVVIGILDQAVDFAHRREKLDQMENPFDPHRGE